MNRNRHHRKHIHAIIPAASTIFETLEDRILLSAVTQTIPSAEVAVYAPAAAVGEVSFDVTSAWNTGFQAALVLTNTSTQDWTEWTIDFDFPHEITSIWNATITAGFDGHYTLGNASWNGGLKAGQSVSFGLIGKLTPGDQPTAPSHIVINNQPPTPVNTPPEAADDSATTLQEQSVYIDVLANDSDADGDALNIAAYTQPAHGSVTQDGALLLYAPHAGYHGPDSFSYTLTDGTDISTAEVTINVEEIIMPNLAPTPQDDAAAGKNTAPITIDVLANDSDPDNDPISIVNWTETVSGRLTENGDGTFTYTPNAGFVGTDHFTYTISDGELQATANVNITVTDSGSQVVTTWPDRFFAPYLDATLPSDYSMVQAAENLNVKYFTFAFVVADPTTSAPSWGGYYSTESGYRLDEIQALRDVGGDVMISFGGAANTELAAAISDVNDLTAAYQSVIDKYELTMIDFDVEGAWVRDVASIDRRSQAIANLQASAAADGRELGVWFTLPVLPTGLTPDGMYVIESALRYGVDIAGVNVMAMDYGDWAAPNPDGQMGEYAIQAAENLHAQMTTLYADAGVSISATELWGKVGVTPMIGQNDVNTEVFYLQDAQELLDFAYEKNIGMLSFWSVTRDNPGTGLGNNHSGLDQETGAFQSLFAPYTGDLIPAVSIADAQVIESDTGAEMVFTVTLSQPHDQTVTVQFATADGSAVAGADYAAASGTLTFAAGETQKEIRVAVTGELTAEADETITVQLANATNATLRDAQATGTILDDDAPPTLTIDDAAVAEGDSGNTQMQFTVRLSRALKNHETVTVNYATSDGAAAAGADYIAAAGTLTIGPGEDRGVVAVSIIGETAEESDEAFNLNLSGVTGAVLGDSRAVGTIEDDDTPMGVADLTVTSDWGSGHIGQMTLTNTTDAHWDGWRLTFTYDYEITSIWSAKIVSHVGNVYVIEPASWTEDIAAGGSLTFGFQADGSPGDDPDYDALLVPLE